jgi:hypothetical protein
VDCAVLSRLVLKDKRVTYVIYNREIYSKARAAEGWRKYTGDNPHTKHMHVSVKASLRTDNTTPWIWTPGQPNPV